MMTFLIDMILVLIGLGLVFMLIASILIINFIFKILGGK